jgi:hypothetical protein
MRPNCVDRAVGAALLDDARAGRQALTPEHLAHLVVCSSCRVGVERLTRLTRTWRAFEPSAAELSTAHARFTARPRRRSTSKTVSRGAAVVIVLVTAAASAAVRVAVTRHAPATDSAAESRPAPAVTPRSQVARQRGDKAVDDTVPSEIVPEVSVEDLRPAPALPIPVPQQATPESRWDSLAVEGGSAHASPAPSADPLSEAGAPASTWTAAASALRIGDYARAERAFDDLARAPDAPTRDAARLARAQVWIAQGRESEARPELEELERAGATALVRQRAADALDALP